MNPLRVLVDGVAFQNRQSGIQRYYLEMLRRLPDCEPALFLNGPAVASLPERCKVVERPEHFPASARNLPLRAWRKIRRRWLPTHLPEANVFHSTYFTRSPKKGLPEVVTVHDMVHECFPYHFIGDVNADIARHKDCILNATAIIAISAATRADLLSIYPEVAGRVHVIHHGAEHLLSYPQPSSTDSKQPFVLYVGDRGGYKNFATLVAALNESDWPADIILKVVGWEFSEAERLFFRHCGVERKVIHVGRVADAELMALYQGAEAFVIPSMCEGFGFPLVEAQAAGVPVVASDIPIFREVGGDGVSFFTPLNPSDLAHSVKRVLESSWREQAIELGHKNVSRFSWERCAQETAEVFRTAAGL